MYIFNTFFANFRLRSKYNLFAYELNLDIDCKGIYNTSYITSSNQVVGTSTPMGNKFTKEEEDSLSESLQDQYFFQSNQVLLHKATNAPCTLHKIATFSKQQSAAVSRNIDNYRSCKCQSVSRLREHYELDNTGYCSDQEKFYLIFDGGPSPNVKEEFFNRRYQQTSFSAQEIEDILSCLLCGLRQYTGVFARKEIRLGLQSVCIDRQQKNKLWMRDPWLLEKSNQNSKPSVNFLATYPSPEKILSSTQATIGFDQYKSDLFTIGVFGLQLYSMNFQDQLYLQKRFVDRAKINQSLSQIRQERLRGGIAILLNENPEHRLQIYHYWNVLCSRRYSLFSENNQHSNTNAMVPQHPRVQYPQIPNRHQNMYSNVGVQGFQANRNNFGVSTVVDPRPNIVNFQKKPVFEKPTEFHYDKPYGSKKNRASVEPPAKVKPSNRRPVSFNNSIHDTPKFNYLQSSNYNSANYEHINNNNQPILGPSSYKNTQINSLTNSMHGSSKVYFGASRIPLSKSIVSSSQFQQPSSATTSFGINYKPASISENTISFDRYSPPHSMALQAPRDSNKHITQSVNISPYQPDKEQKINNHQMRSPQPDIKQSIISSLLESEDEQRKQPLSVSPLQDSDEQRPTSPSTIQNTPQQPIRNKNKYNSTIVQVNEETPNQSQQSDEEGQNKAIEFVVEEYETGSRYQGFKKNGVRNGKGKFFYQDGGYYDGDWKNNQMHGWGKLFYQGGKLAYEGNWAHDEFHGYGKVYNDNPVPLDGGFDFTNFDLLDDYWEYYEGMLANDTKEGRGRIKLTNNQVFEGDFHTDRIQGFGKFLKQDGSLVQGIWRDSRLIKVLNKSDIYQ